MLVFTWNKLSRPLVLMYAVVWSCIVGWQEAWGRASGFSFSYRNPCLPFGQPTLRPVVGLHQVSNLHLADSMCLSSVVFTQLFSKVAQCQPAKPAQKQNVMWNSQSRSFKVTHFGICEKQTIDCASLYNNAGLISKVSSEDISGEKAESCRCRQPLCHSPGNLRASEVTTLWRFIN